MEADAAFTHLLRSYDLDQLDKDHASIVGVSSDFVIRYVNQAWFRFALENGGGEIRSRWSVGASIDRALPQILRDFYMDAWRTAARAGAIWEHDYECPSPEQQRHLRMRAVPLEEGALLMIHSVIIESDHCGSACSGRDVTGYRNEHGIITQCSHCRRVLRPGVTEQWDWVPACVDQVQAHTSHGLCEPCLAHYYRAPAGAGAADLSDPPT